MHVSIWNPIRCHCLKLSRRLEIIPVGSLISALWHTAYSLTWLLHQRKEAVPLCFKQVQRLAHSHLDQEVPDVVVHNLRVPGNTRIRLWRLEGCYVTLQQPLHCQIKVFTDIIITCFLAAPGCEVR